MPNTTIASSFTSAKLLSSLPATKSLPPRNLTLIMLLFCQLLQLFQLCWLGLLHSPTPYQWEGQGEFYREAWDIWIIN